MKEFFLDSSAIFALVDRSSSLSVSLREKLQKEKAHWVISNFVFAESISLILKRIGKKVAEQTGDFLQKSEIVKWVYIDRNIQEQAWSLLKKYKDKDFDLIDATSFIICKKRAIQTVVTLDHHFKQMGFVTIS